MTSETITRRAAAKMVGVHEDTLSRLLNGVLAAAVLDRKGRGAALVLSRPAIEVYVAVQRETRPFDPQQERARRDAASADLAELRLDVERGRYLEVQDVRITWSRELVAIRNRLLAFASRLSLTLGVDAAVIEGEVHEVLTELSDPSRDLRGDDDAGESKTPAKKATRKKKAPAKKRTRCKVKRKATTRKERR